jgi:hypothetical protein
MSAYLRDKLLDHVYGGPGLAQPTYVWVKLHVGDPGASGLANAATEATRKQLVCGAALGGSKANSSPMQWNNYPAAETISHASVWDASTLGNCLEYGPLNAAVAVPVGFNLVMPAGQVVLTLV